MIAALETYFGHGITPGEAIVIALTTIPLLIGLVLRVLKVRFPLSLEFYVPGSSEKYRRFQQVAEGEWPITIRLKTRVPENVRAIDIRFVEKQLLRKPLNASQEMIRITEITKMEWGDQLSAEGWRASPNGRGHLSFEGRSDRRLYVRASFSILQDAFTGSILSSS